MSHGRFIGTITAVRLYDGDLSVQDQKGQIFLGKSSKTGERKIRLFCTMLAG
jgi:hypothetical protein